MTYNVSRGTLNSTIPYRDPRLKILAMPLHKIWIYSVVYVWMCCTQYESVSSWAFDLGWPPSSHTCDQSCTNSCDGDGSADKSSTLKQFYEGSFLRMLLDKLSRMLYQV